MHLQQKEGTCFDCVIPSPELPVLNTRCAPFHPTWLDAQCTQSRMTKIFFEGAEIANFSWMKQPTNNFWQPLPRSNWGLYKMSCTSFELQKLYTLFNLFPTAKTYCIFNCCLCFNLTETSFVFIYLTTNQDGVTQNKTCKRNMMKNCSPKVYISMISTSVWLE